MEKGFVPVMDGFQKQYKNIIRSSGVYFERICWIVIHRYMRGKNKVNQIIGKTNDVHKESGLSTPYSQRHAEEIAEKKILLSISRKARNQIYQLLIRGNAGHQTNHDMAEDIFDDIRRFYEPKCFNSQQKYVKTDNLEDFIIFNSPFCVLDAIEISARHNTLNDFQDRINTILRQNEIMFKLDNGEIVASSDMDNTDKPKVFIVHGKDNEVKLEVARFIEKMGFEPVILHEQASGGMTIIEKIEKYSDVGFGIILYTPCDIGCERDDEDSKKFRARQNVVFEHGYLIARLGRDNVCALVKQGVETPNDISGIVYVTFDSNGGWKISLAKEMKRSGYAVDLNLFL